MNIRRYLQSADVRRLAVCLALGVLLAVITGPQGRSGQPTYAIIHALKPVRLSVCLAVGVVLWLMISGYAHEREQIHEAWLPVRSAGETAWKRRKVRAGVNLGLLAIAILYPLFQSDYWRGVDTEQIGIYALLAVGLNVVVGFAGLLDLGYIAFYAIGAYVAAYFTNTLPVHPPFTLDPFYVFPFAILAAMTAGLILGAPTLRLRGDYLAIVTLGFGEIVTIVAVNLNGVTNGSRGAFGIPAFSVDVGPVKYAWDGNNLPYYYLTLGLLVTVVILFSMLENSRVGRALTAIREDEVAAQACGIPTVRYKLMAFAIGASTSGLAGVIYASKISYINPSSFTVSFSILVLVLVIFGGMGSIYGAIVGAIVIQGALAYMRLHNVIDPGDVYLYIGAILIAMMIFRPQGIIPSRRRAREIGLSEHGIGGADALGAPAGGPTS
jgi:branched-chain amino acid transport system permease protein